MLPRCLSERRANGSMVMMRLWAGARRRRRAGPLGPGQRWSVARKRAVVLRLIAGEPVELVSREIGVPVFKLERWRERAEAALEGALKEREMGADGADLAAALRRIGELSMEVELLRAKMGRSRGPLARGRWR